MQVFGKVIKAVVFVALVFAIVLIPTRIYVDSEYASDVWRAVYDVNLVEEMSGIARVIGLTKVVISSLYFLCYFAEASLIRCYNVISTVLLGLAIVCFKPVRMQISGNWKKITNGTKAIIHLSVIACILGLCYHLPLGFYDILENELIWFKESGVYIMLSTYALWILSLSSNRKRRTRNVKAAHNPKPVKQNNNCRKCGSSNTVFYNGSKKHYCNRCHASWI